MLGLVIGLVLSATSARKHHCSCGHKAVDRAVVSRPVTVEQVKARADQLYRKGEFASAGLYATSIDDFDLKNLARMYDRLDRAWRIGFSPTAATTDAFHALREAWKLDTVLGGAHSEALQRRLGDIALIAGREFERLGDRESKELVTHTCEALGR